jgi:hypothetical protein
MTTSPREINGGTLRESATALLVKRPTITTHILLLVDEAMLPYEPGQRKGDNVRGDLKFRSLRDVSLESEVKTDSTPRGSSHIKEVSAANWEARAAGRKNSQRADLIFVGCGA